MFGICKLFDVIPGLCDRLILLALPPQYNRNNIIFREFSILLSNTCAIYYFGICKVKILI